MPIREDLINEFSGSSGPSPRELRNWVNHTIFSYDQNYNSAEEYPVGGLGNRGPIGLGIDIPQATLHLQRDDENDREDLILESVGGGTEGTLHLRRGRGIPSALRTVEAYNKLGKLLFSGYNGADWIQAAGVGAEAETDFHASADAALTFQTTKNGEVHERLRISSDGYVGVGTTQPERALHILGDGGESDDVIIDSRGDRNSGALIFFKSGGTMEAPSPAQSDDLIAKFGFRGYTGSSFQESASIEAYAATNFDEAATGGIRFMTRDQAGYQERVRITPSGAIRFGDDIKQRKIILWQLSDDEHHFYGLGINGNTLRYQVAGVNDRHVFFAGESPESSRELMRIQGNGHVGIGTSNPHAPLHFSNGTSNRKIVLYEHADNDHQFFGFGINNSTLRYQIYRERDRHVFFVGTGASSSRELMRIQGNGNVGIGTSNPVATLHVDTGSDVDLSANSGMVIIGNPASHHIAMDNNEIMQKRNGTTPGTLHLQMNGGAVKVGGALEATAFTHSSNANDKLIKIRTYSGISGSESPAYNTGHKTNEWNAVIAGFTSVGGDIYEGEARDDLVTVRMVVKNGKWYIQTNFRTHKKKNEKWTVDVMFIRTELSRRVQR